MMKTINCIICNKPAVVWTGHVHEGEDKIIAGFCKSHKKSYNGYESKTERRNCIGCFGDYAKTMESKLMET